METVSNRDKADNTATTSEHAAIKGISEKRVKDWLKENGVTTHRRDGKPIIDAAASEKAAGKKEKRRDETQQVPDVLLQRLAVNAEAAAKKSSSSRKRWQLLSFASLMLFVAASAIAISIYMETDGLRLEQDRLRTDRYSLEEQLNSSNTKINELTLQVNMLKYNNDQLAAENSNLKTQNDSLSNKVKTLNETVESTETKQVIAQATMVESKPSTTKHTVLDKSRLNRIQKGIYPEDMTKAELVAALGEPDRVYKDKIYEQLVYFDRSPGRFWFKNGPFLQTAE